VTVPATRARFAEVVRSEPLDLGLACLLIGGEVEPGFDVDRPLAVLDALTATARPHVPRGGGVRAAAEGLRVALGEQAGFAGFAEDYEDLRSSLLHQVLRRGRGLPILLSVVWLEVAARLDVPAYAVGLPGHVVVGIGDPEDEHVLVDPFAGGRLLTLGDVEHRVQATTGRALVAGDLAPLPASDVLLRLLTNVRVLTTRQAPSLDVARTRLWAVELSLLLPKHPLDLRRERGELLVRLGRHLAGAEELELYAMAVEDVDAAASEQVRREARLARAQLN
jgi:regulator of sirC expression with transglutaminase-like and TPR domain